VNIEAQIPVLDELGDDEYAVVWFGRTGKTLRGKLDGAFKERAGTRTM
jgi:hypothetical protein